jgi:hypothetical protein
MRCSRQSTATYRKYCNHPAASSTLQSERQASFGVSLGAKRTTFLFVLWLYTRRGASGGWIACRVARLQNDLNDLDLGIEIAPRLRCVRRNLDV